MPAKTAAHPRDHRPAWSLLLAGAAAACLAFAGSAVRAEDAGARPVLSAEPYRTLSVNIPLNSGDEAGHWIEWLVRAKAGTPLLYSWSVSGVTEPEEFYSDLFGHGVEPGTGEDVSYQKFSGLFSNGAVTVPYDGLHGWYFKNDSAGAVVVHLRLSGDFEVVSAEELAAIQAADEP